jgi:tetratricopeptide (TPR) repeat protein
MLGNLPLALSHYELAATMVDADDHSTRASLLNSRASIISEHGDYMLARSMFEEALEIYRTIGHPNPWATLNNLGILEYRLGNTVAARSYFLECARDLDRRAKPQLAGVTLCNLADAELRLGMLEYAAENCAAAIRAWQECGAHIELPAALELMGCIAGRRRDSYRTAKLLGAAASLRDVYGVPCRNASELSRIDEEARRSLGDEVYDRATADGALMSLESALAYALCA